MASPARTIARLTLCAAMVGAGVLHLTAQRAEFQAQVPDWFPLDDDFTVLASVAVEIALGATFIAVPQKKRLIGGLLAAGVVYLLEMIDRRVRSRSDLEARLALPTLGRLSRWQPAGGRLLPAPNFSARAARALPHPW